MSKSFDFNTGTTLPAGLTAAQGSFTLSSGRLTLSGADPGAPGWVAVESSGSGADTYVKAVVRTSSNVVNNGGVVARYTNTSNFWHLRINPPGNLLELRKYVAGSWTTADSFSVTLSANTDYELELRCLGNDITGYLDGVERVSTTDAFNNTAIIGGIRASGDVYEFDDLEIASSVAATASIWVGHVTTAAVTLSAQTNQTDAKFVISENSDLSGTTIDSATITADSFGVITATVSGLSANTTYYVGIESSSTVIGSGADFGRFKTLPSTSTISESIAFACCGDSATNALIFDTIADKADSDEISFFVHTGDMHYENITTNTESLYQDAFDAVFASARQSRIFRRMPLYYMWDDHDYGDDDSDGTSASRTAAVSAFRGRVPTPTLAEAGATDAVYYSFVRGRVRYVMTDLRSERSPKGNTDNASKIVMGVDQLQWFKDECLAAKAAGQVIAWMSTYSFSETTTAGSDRWGGYNTQRQEILDFWSANDLEQRIFVFSGDYHFLAYDDGTNAPGGVTVMQAGPLDRVHGASTETYTEGPFKTSESQYGQLDVTDDGGDTITFRFRGWVVDQADGTETTAIDETFTATANPGPYTVDLDITGIPDGTYTVRLYDHADGGFIDEENLTFSSGAASHQVLRADGAEVDGYVLDGNGPPTNGAVIYAVVSDGT